MRRRRASFTAVVFALLVVATVAAFAWSQRLKRDPLVLDRVSFGTAVARSFTPNGDCRFDQIRIRFRTTVSDTGDVQVVKPGGKLIVTLARDTYLDAWAAAGVTLPRVTWEAFPALMMPVILFGCLYSGITTPTEAAAAAAAYALAASAVLYRSITWRGIYASLMTSARITVSIGMLIAGALVFTFALGVGELGAQLIELGLELLRVAELLLLRFPPAGDVGGTLLEIL